MRLTKGEYSSRKVYDASPYDMARAFEDCGVGRIHIVDLDGAKASKPVNLKVLEEIASHAGIEVEWGGGVSGPEALSMVFNAGASQAIIGSIAALDPGLFGEWLSMHGPSRIVLGADVRGRNVAVKGWLETTSISIDSLLERFIPMGLSQAIVTDISRDGMLQGPDSGFYEALQKEYPQVDFTVSGGISSMEDIRALDSAGLRKVIVGKAIYENRISLEEIREWSLKG